MGHNPINAVGRNGHGRKDPQHFLLWCPFEATPSELDSPAETIGSLVNHVRPWYVYHFQPKSQ